MGRESGVWPVGRAALSRCVCPVVFRALQRRDFSVQRALSLAAGALSWRGSPGGCTRIYCASLS